MTDVKFRGRSVKKTKEWVYGYYIELNCYVLDEDKDEMIDARRGFIQPFTHEDYEWDNRSMVKRITVGRFTGKQDGYKKDIYEDDIIDMQDDSRYVVKWDEDQLAFILDDIDGSGDVGLLGSYYSSVLEVVGNIHEDSHLLTK